MAIAMDLLVIQTGLLCHRCLACSNDQQLKHFVGWCWSVPPTFRHTHVLVIGIRVWAGLTVAGNLAGTAAVAAAELVHPGHLRSSHLKTQTLVI